MYAIRSYYDAACVFHAPKVAFVVVFQHGQVSGGGDEVGEDHTREEVLVPLARPGQEA